MARKTHFAGFAAVAATLTITFASTAFSGANAQQGVEIEIQDSVEAAPITEEVVPVFVSEEVVQPLPAEDETPAENADAPQASSLRQLVREIDTSADLSNEMECLAGTVHRHSLRG